MASKSSSLPILLLLVLLSLTAISAGRLITGSSSDLISDGIHDSSTGMRLLRLNPFRSSPGETCEQTYGFMPCTTTVLGNLFLILVYGYLMYLAATYLSGGSELLLQILGPGLVGGLLLPILGALPDAMLILVSGLSGSVETAQDQVSVGMGLLAGSTVMLLTVIWGTCIVVGKCDIQNSVAEDGIDTKQFSITGSGVSTDIWTSYAARIMAISIIPFLIVQLPQILHSNSGRHLAVLIALIGSLLLLVSYCVYQVVQPSVQKRRLDFAKHKHLRSRILKYLKKRALGRLLTDEGKPNEEVLRKLYTSIDVNEDGYLSYSELRALIAGLRIYEINLNEDDALDKLMKDFDKSKDSQVDFPEFVNGIAQWLDEAKGSKVGPAVVSPNTLKYIHYYYDQTKREHDLLVDQSEDVEGVDDPRATTIKAVLSLILGTIIAAVFADPLVDAVDNFSSASSIPSFFISFIALPLATNSSEAVSAIIFATRKKQRSASLTFSELYGAVTMNNTLCLSVFLALVYLRGLTWDFSSEVLVILIVCIVMGVFASFRTTFPLWTSFIAFLLYPASLVLVYVLDYVFGWS